MGNGPTPGGGYVAFTVTVAAAGSESLGGSYGAGPFTASTPTSGSATYAGGMSRTFTVNLRITRPSPVPGPDVQFEIGRSRLEDGQEGAVSKWFQGLPPEVRDGIRNGRRTVTVSGYASTTARRGRNRGLSEDRARVVERILRGHAGSAATIHVFYLGEDAANTPDETEDPKWRRATIMVQAPGGTSPAPPAP